MEPKLAADAQRARMLATSIVTAHTQGGSLAASEIRAAFTGLGFGAATGANVVSGVGMETVIPGGV
jgi:hypothetical protein